MNHNQGKARTASQILIILMMGAIIISGPLVLYSWATGYFEFLEQQSQPAITIQSITNDDTDLLVYVQNTGKGIIRLAEEACLYVDGELVECLITGVAVSNGLATISEGETATIRYLEGAVLPEIEVTVKVTPMVGSPSEGCAYPGGSERDPPVLDHFEFDFIESPQTSGTSFNILIKAVDQYGLPFTDYSGANTLNCSNGQITPTRTGGFLYGVWSGKVTVTGNSSQATITTVAEFDNSKTGKSNPFSVLAETTSTVLSQTPEGPENDSCYLVVATIDGGWAMSSYTNGQPQTVNGPEQPTKVKTSWKLQP